MDCTCDREHYAEMLELCQTGIDGILELDSHINKNEPFLRDNKVIGMTGILSEYVFNRINHLWEVLYKHTHGMSRMYVEPIKTGYRVYFVAHQGKNGCGDFAKNDLSEAITILQGLRKLYKNATMIDMRHDILDDVSSWSYVFEV